MQQNCVLELTHEEKKGKRSGLECLRQKRFCMISYSARAELIWKVYYYWAQVGAFTGLAELIKDQELGLYAKKTVRDQSGALFQIAKGQACPNIYGYMAD